MAVPHHGAHGGGAGGAAIAPVIHREKIEALAAEEGGQLVIIGHDLAVAVEEEEGGGGGRGRMKAGSHYHMIGHRDEEVRGFGTVPGEAGFGAGVEEAQQHLRHVQGGIIYWGRVNHGNGSPWGGKTLTMTFTIWANPLRVNGKIGPGGGKGNSAGTGSARAGSGHPKNGLVLTPAMGYNAFHLIRG